MAGPFPHCTCFGARRGGGSRLPAGAFVPSCDEDGYYRRAQCAPGGGECWCVDQQHGTELSGTRARGRPDCGKERGEVVGRQRGGRAKAAPLHEPLLAPWHRGHHRLFGRLRQQRGLGG